MLGKLKKMLSNGLGADGPAGRPAPVDLSRRYSIVLEAAHGSMSRVYKALDGETGRTVCLKVQNVEKNQAAAARSSKGEDKPDEGEITSKIVSPHVVRTLDHGVSTKGEHFLVMEFIPGVSLKYLIESRSFPGLRDRLKLLGQAAEGVAAVHAAGFIHHDISPLNFLVTNDPVVVKLIDFGLAVPNTPAFRKPGNRTGTLNYMAPELIRRDTTDERIDIFSFGVLAFEFLTGRLPYETSTSMKSMVARLNNEPFDPGRFNPDLPAAVQDLLRKLTARRREDRWPQMETVPAALKAIRSKLLKGETP
jgi:serine/threonine protein kinase